MAKMQNRIDMLAERTACDRIRTFDEGHLDRELSRMGVNPDMLLRRLGAMVGLDPAARTDDDGSLVPKTGNDQSSAAHPPLSLDATPNPQLSTASAAAIGACAPAAGAFELAGEVKFFDSTKGFGFVVADNGLGDVLLHISCLQASHYQTAYEGARVHALVQRGPKGLQALQILSMDESTAIHPSQLPQRTKEKVQPESDWVRVAVCWYNLQKGYGFATRGEGTPDLFVHAETLRRWGFAPLWSGQVVEVRWGMGSKGCMVAEIRHPDGLSGFPAAH